VPVQLAVSTTALRQTGAKNHLHKHDLDTPGRCVTYCEGPADCADDHACIAGTCVPVVPCPGTEQEIVDVIAEGGGVFGCMVPPTVTTTTEIVIESDAILGSLEDLTIEGDGNHRVFRVLQGVTVELLGLTISEGGGVDYGGAIYNEGTLTLTDTKLSGNRANIGGGAIYTEGTQTLYTYSGVFEENQSGTNGGAIYVNSGDVYIYRNSQFLNNTATENGGAFFVSSSSLLNLQESIVSGNHALEGNGGGIYADSVVSVPERRLRVRRGAEASRRRTQLPAHNG